MAKLQILLFIGLMMLVASSLALPNRKKKRHADPLDEPSSMPESEEAPPPEEEPEPEQQQPVAYDECPDGICGGGYNGYAERQRQPPPPPPDDK